MNAGVAEEHAFGRTGGDIGSTAGRLLAQITVASEADNVLVPNERLLERPDGTTARGADFAGRGNRMLDQRCRLHSKSEICDSNNIRWMNSSPKKRVLTTQKNG